MKTIRSLVSLSFFLCIAQLAPAAVPSAISYQGRLTNASGIPQPGVKAMSIKIYDASIDGILLYSETIGNVNIDANGVYGFQFGASGAGTPAILTNALVASTEQWLELSVDEAAQAPRQKILTVPFALMAGGLPDRSISSSMIADGAIGVSKISDLGTAALTAATDYASAAQGLLADSASQPGHTHAVAGINDITPTGLGLMTAANAEIALNSLGAGPMATRSKYAYGNDGVLRSLKTMLDTGEDAAIGIITDSTGNATNEWVYLISAEIAIRYPGHRVLYRLWNDATKVFDLKTIQAGTGGDRHINYPAGSTYGFHMGASNMLESFVASDIEIQTEISLDAGGYPGSSCILLSWGSGGGRGWFEFGTNGGLSFHWSEDASGTTLKTAYSTANMPSLTAGAKYTFRVTLDIDNGATGRDIKFWYSANGSSAWNQLGATVTQAGVTTIVSPPGSSGFLQNTRGSAPAGGVKFYRVQIYKGIGGQPLLPERIDLWQNNMSGGGNMASISGAPIFHIDNIANSGWSLNSHINLQTAPQTAYIERGKLFWILASSHNDQGFLGKEWGDKADTLMAMVHSKSTNPPPTVIVTQNPESSGAVWHLSHTRRSIAQISVASSRNWPCIDVAGAWRDYGDWSGLMQDSIHPNSLGSALTKNTVMKALGF